MVFRTTMSVSVFHSSVSGLDSLLREWDVAARDGVQIGLGRDLGLHDELTSERSRLTRGAIETGTMCRFEDTVGQTCLTSQNSSSIPCSALCVFYLSRTSGYVQCSAKQNWFRPPLLALYIAESAFARSPLISASGSASAIPTLAPISTRVSRT